MSMMCMAKLILSNKTDHREHRIYVPVVFLYISAKGGDYMATFSGIKHTTIGIQNEILPEMQIILWNMIDENINKGLQMDYLQIFDLKATHENGELEQKIIHQQEQPRRKNTVTVNSSNPVYAKIFVIDDISYVTMLLNHEY